MRRHLANWTAAFLALPFVGAIFSAWYKRVLKTTSKESQGIELQYSTGIDTDASRTPAGGDLVGVRERAGGEVNGCETNEGVHHGHVAIDIGVGKGDDIRAGHSGGMPVSASEENGYSHARDEVNEPVTEWVAGSWGLEPEDMEAGLEVWEDVGGHGRVTDIGRTVGVTGVDGHEKERGGGGVGPGDTGRWCSGNVMKMCQYKGGVVDFLAPRAANRHDRSLAVVKERFCSLDEYLRTMQAHTDAEFACSVMKAREAAERREDGGWRRWRRLGLLELRSKRDMDSGEYVIAVENCDEWVGDPWAQHAVEFKGSDGVFLLTSSGTAKSVDPSCPKKLRGLLLCKGELCKGDEGYGVVRGPKRGLLAMQCEEPGLPRTRRSLDDQYKEGGLVRSLGFVGSHLLAYESAQQLRIWLADGPSSSCEHQWALLRDVACPSSVSHAEVQRLTPTLLPPDNVDSLSAETVNHSQREAIRMVREGLSLIHGPPGTGKSTTILHLINSRTPPESKVLVTCTRNQAVNAVVDKVARVKGGVLAFGLEKNIKEATKKYTLRARVESDAVLRYIDRLCDTWERKSMELSKEESGEKVIDLQQWQKDQQRNAPDGLGMYPAIESQVTRVTSQSSSTVDDWRALLKQSSSFVRIDLQQVKHQVRRRILRDTRVYICTIDSTPRFVRELREAMAQYTTGIGASVAGMDRVSIDTVIMDEAGCVLETALPILLRWAPANLVLIGDHKQLPPYTSLDGSGRAAGYEADMMKGGHARSLMERCTRSNVPAPMLNVQYRMHPSICRPVSLLFYESRLQSHESLDSTRSRSELARRLNGAAVWVNTTDPETKLPRAGYRNKSEVDIVMRVLSMMKGERRTVFVITFYKAQKNAIEERVKRDYGQAPAGLSVMTVDSAQGSEADVVILSAVRSRTRTASLSAFMDDKRRICVALSRARELCVVVGNAGEISKKGGKDWKGVVGAYIPVEI